MVEGRHVFTGDDSMKVVLHQTELPDIILVLFISNAPDIVSAL